MKKIIPFQKEITFKDHLSEIVSISLEHDIQKKDVSFHGNFIVSGEYKLSTNSTHIDRFHFDLPFEIELDDKYDLSSSKLDIDDFYYEVINNQILSVHIDVLIDRLEEKVIEIPEEEIVLVEEKEERAEIKPIDEESIEDITREVIEEGKKEERNEDLAEPLIKEESDKKEDIMEDVKAEEENRWVREEVNSEIKEVKEEPMRKEKSQENIKNLFDHFIDDNDYQSYKVYIVKENDNMEMILKKYNVSIEDIKKYNELGELKKGDKIIIPYVKSKQN